MTRVQASFWDLTTHSVEEAVRLYFDPIRRLRNWLLHLTSQNDAMHKRVETRDSSPVDLSDFLQKQLLEFLARAQAERPLSPHEALFLGMANRHLSEGFAELLIALAAIDEATETVRTSLYLHDRIEMSGPLLENISKTAEAQLDNLINIELIKAQEGFLAMKLADPIAFLRLGHPTYQLVSALNELSQLLLVTHLSAEGYVAPQALRASEASASKKA